MKRLVVTVLLTLITSQVYAIETFSDYVNQLLVEAEAKGISTETTAIAKHQIQYRPSVIKADKNQPEKKITLSDYLSTRVPDWKVAQAVRLFNENQRLLEKIASEYGVQPRFIVALWGNESNFGRIQGKYPVLSSLASLAFEGRRESLFKSQFFAALEIVESGDIAIENLLGSWAGAMGQSQFMPTNYLAYAVDYDGDGRKDIWQTNSDVFASIANFLKQHGWDHNYTWGRQVNGEKLNDFPSVGLDKAKQRSLLEWQQLGVTRYDGNPLPSVDMPAWLIMPDGITGRHYLVYNNFQTLMRWNRSSYFGISVAHLSERMNKRLRK